MMRAFPFHDHSWKRAMKSPVVLNYGVLRSWICREQARVELDVTIFRYRILMGWRIFMMEINLVPAERIEKAILSIRGQKVMLDKDLAQLYDVPTKVLNQAV